MHVYYTVGVVCRMQPSCIEPPRRQGDLDFPHSALTEIAGQMQTKMDGPCEEGSSPLDQFSGVDDDRPGSQAIASPRLRVWVSFNAVTSTAILRGSLSSPFQPGVAWREWSYPQWQQREDVVKNDGGEKSNKNHK
jgi:hypothetical protein